LRGGEGGGGGGENAAPPSPRLLLRLGGKARGDGWGWWGGDPSGTGHGKGWWGGVDRGMQLGIDVTGVPLGEVGADAVALDVWATGFEGFADGAAGCGGAGGGGTVGGEEVELGEDIFFGFGGSGTSRCGGGDGGGGGGDVGEEVVEDVGGFGHSWMCLGRLEDRRGGGEGRRGGGMGGLIMRVDHVTIEMPCHFTYIICIIPHSHLQPLPTPSGKPTYHSARPLSSPQNEFRTRNGCSPGHGELHSTLPAVL